ncbi:alpha/beta hydrolase fold domain-containing protein [Hymenobacter sp. BT559]|uniref:alpha/beta hydrolase fold domain-containing protein n=1 Tax=Hymenobacter sp. BT559 TaxID=2795729 RepID=UPI0018EDE1B1|nr:alpha/beta hydrolase fold domain-containing protein [Hymenobacter sp. BT559]MBJ6142080.1 alpha/beta hydrolase fold domain-containing protein [Hymenobacter sp. BT559]
MQKIVCLWVCLFGLVCSAHGQNAAAACGNGRYVEDIFTDADIQTTSGVLFGRNTVRSYTTNTEGPPKDLLLDVYQPAGDGAVQRPLLLFAFGGAFVTGSRTDAEVVSICRRFARKGYVAAAIDYRLMQLDGPTLAANAAIYANNLADEVVRATNDMRAAVRYFKYDAAGANAYHIDPARIFVGGYSAGAITALQVAYTDTDTENSNAAVNAAYATYGGLEGNTDLPGTPLLGAYTSKGLVGVVNLAGGVNDLGLLSAGNPPLYSAQGTTDDVVPYNCGTIQPTQFTICGSGALQPVATAAGILNQLHPVANGSHSSPVTDPEYTQIINEAAAFLQPLVCAAPLPVTLTSFSGRVAPDDCTATLAWQTATEHNSYAYEVQGSSDGQAYERLSTVPSRNRAAGASYSFRVGRRVELRYFRLRMLDIGGAAAFSPVVALASCSGAPLVVAPTPSRDQATVSGLPAGRCIGVLYSATGQVMAQASGTTTISLRLGGLAPGIYLLKVQHESGATVGTAKVVKE